MVLYRTCSETCITHAEKKQRRIVSNGMCELTCDRCFTHGENTVAEERDKHMVYFIDNLVGVGRISKVEDKERKNCIKLHFGLPSSVGELGPIYH